MTSPDEPCPLCEGSGRLAGGTSTSWPKWRAIVEELDYGELLVEVGGVKPIDCWACGGSGRAIDIHRDVVTR